MLYIDDILLVTNDIDLLAETKKMLCNHFDMKDLGDASFFLGIKLFKIGLIMCCIFLKEPIL